MICCRSARTSFAQLLPALLVLLIGPLQEETAHAQSNRYSGTAFEPLTDTYFFLQYEGGDDWAQGTQQAQFGATRYIDAPNGNGLWLNYGQFGFDHDGHHSLNAGVVRRFWLGGGIVGIGGHYDLTRSAFENDFQKVAITGEWFSSDSNWIVRGEGNFAVGPDSFLIQDLGTTVDELFFQGNNLMFSQTSGQIVEEGLSGLEYEIARALGNYAAEGYLGGYHYLGQKGEDANGIKGGVRGFISPALLANLEVRNDNVFGSSLYGGITMFLGGPARNQRHTLADQMIMPVQRHDQAIINTVDTRVMLPNLAVTQGGDTLTFTHIDNVNTGDGGNSGTYEDPFTSLAAASGSSHDIVYVHSGTVFTNDGYVMSNGQRLLGEGAGNQHQLMTDQFGLILLPEVNGIAGARPIIRGGATPIMVAGNSELSNFDIQQASRTLMFDNVPGDVDVNRLSGSGSIDIIRGSGNYTFSDVHIVDSTNGGLRIDGGSSNVTFEGLYGGSSLSVLDGYAVAIQNNHSGTVLFPTASSISTTNAQGFSFLNGLSGTYVFNGTNNILNASNDALTLANAGGVYIFGENTGITNNGNSAVVMDLTGVNNIDFTYGGSILNNSGNAIRITGGPATGQSIRFNSSAENALQDSADGIHIADTGADISVTADTELTGQEGLTIRNGDGTYSFADTDINLSPGTDPSLLIDGGTGMVNFGEASSVTNDWDRAAVRVEGGHTGTLSMDGTVASAAGEGIEFDNADGTYNFGGTTNLNGTTRGIRVANGSSGTFSYSEYSHIANTTDDAIQMDLTNADQLDFTYSGTIRNTTGRAIDISGGPGVDQSVLFNSTAANAITDSGEGIRIASTNADITVQSNTELTGSNGIEIVNSTGTYTFSNTNVDLSSGSNAAMSIDGGSSDIVFEANSSITNDQNRMVVSVGNGHSGNLTMDGTITSTSGLGILFSDADGTYNFSGNTTLDRTARGLQIDNGSSGTFAFSEGTAISNTTNEAILMDLTGADGIDVTYSGTIRNSSDAAVEITGGPGIGQSIIFNSTTADAIQDSGEGIHIWDTAANVSVLSDTELTGANGLRIQNSTGQYTFADTDIALSLPGGPSLSIQGGSSNVEFGSDSSITNDQNRYAVAIGDGHTGSLTMDGQISSTAGGGLSFSNADGTYAFNGMTTLDGVNAGISITDRSEGTFTFSEDTSIVNTGTSAAISINTADADNLDFTYSGTVNNSSGRAIEITGGPGTNQSVLFNSTAANAIQDSGQGIRIANTGADIVLQSETMLTGTSGISIVNSTGSYTFANTDISLSSGGSPSLWVSGGSSNVHFGTNSSMTHTQSGRVVSVDNGHTGTMNMDGTILSTAGGGIFFDNADGIYNFNGSTALNGTTRGIDVTNGSAGTFTFSEDTSITGPSAGGVRLNMTNADDLAFTYSGTIQNSTGLAIDISGGPGTGQTVLFNSTVEDAIQNSGEGIWIANTNANVILQSDTELTGSSGIQISEASGTFTFSDTDISLTTGTNPALLLEGGSSIVNFSADSSIINDQNRTALLIMNGHTGTLNVDGSIVSTDGFGIRFDNADGTYLFNGMTTHTGPGRGVHVTNGSSGTFAFSEDTAIANTLDPAIELNLANADNLDFTYSGTIQNSTGRAISVTGGPGTGQSILFNSTATDAIQDSGAGIQIADTNADVNIQSDTELTGANGIEISNSTGTYTFADTDIALSVGTNSSLRIDGGSSTVNFGTNSSILNDQSRNVVRVEDGHTGTLNMAGTISSTDGFGIEFDNADGLYNFTGSTTLDGTGRGIRVDNGSSGTFAFSETTSIANTTQAGIQIDLANADNLAFTYSGTIQNSTGRAIDITGGPGTGQTVLFNSTATDAIQDSGQGIWIANTDADVNIQSDTELTGSNGVTITNSTGTYTFADTDINLSSGSDPSLLLDGGTGTVNFGANSSITNNQNRAVVSVENGHTGTLNMDGNISSTAGTGIVFDNADGTYTFNGTTSLNGTTRGIDVANGSIGTFTFSETTSITNTTDEAVRIDTTNADNLDFTYSGTIQNATGRAISVTGGPGTGQSILFNSTATDAIQDSGTGILIAGTDADVNVQSDTELTGSAGLTIAGADGTYTFADTDIDLSSGAIAPLLIDGGTGTVLFGTNSSISNDLDRIALMVQGGHTGTLTMNGVVSSTDGAGLDFSNADGTYTFNGTTTLDGTDRGLRVSNGSAGTFTFSEDTSIANTLNEAVLLDLANADNMDFTYSGTIQNSTGRAIDITGGPGTGQSVVFNSTATDAIQDSGDGIRISNTDANVNIQSDTELTGSNGVEITNSTGIYTFADTDINLSSGTDPSLLLDGGSSTVNFSGNSSITNNQNRTVVTVENGHTGTLNMDGTISSTAGDGIVFDNADGNYNFNGTTNLNGTTRGIHVTNGSAGSFAFSENTSIVNTTDEAVRMDLTNADNLDFTYSGTIQNSTGVAIDISGAGTGQSILFNSTAADAIQDSGQGIWISNTDADIDFQSDTELTGLFGLLIVGSDGTNTFADADINLGGGATSSLLITGGSGTVNFGANSSITNNSNRPVVHVLGGHTGTLNMDGDVSSTAGEGLVFNNADGTYNFNGTTNLNGTSDGIQILNNSSGTFTFSADTSITNTTGRAAFEEANSTANVTYNGTITQNTAQNAVNITDKTGGSTTFNGQVTANTSSAIAIHLEDNAGSTTSFNGGLDIDTTTGIGLYARNAGNVNVTGTGNSIYTTNGEGVRIENTTVDMTFDEITVLQNSFGTSGIRLNTMSGDFEVTGTTTIGSNGTVGTGIDISSGTFDQTGNITFGEVFLGAAGTGGAGRAFSVDGSGQTISFGDTTIAGLWNQGDLRYRSTGSTSSLTFDSLDNTAATAVRGLAIQNSAGSVTVNGGMIEGRSGSAIDVDSGTGAITINSTIIDTSGGGNVVSVSGRNGSSSAINFNGDVIGNGSAILVDNNTGGIINFNDDVVMTGVSGLYVDNNSGTTINFTGPTTVFDTAFTAIGFVNNASTTALNFSGGNLDATSAFMIALDATGPGTIAITGMNNSISAVNDDAIDIDGIVFSLNNTWVNNAGAYYTIETHNSTLSGNGNIAPNFNSTGGGNTGVIEFNGGLDLAP